MMIERVDDPSYRPLSEEGEPKRAAFQRSVCSAFLAMGLLPILYLDNVPFGISDILKG